MQIRSFSCNRRKQQIAWSADLGHFNPVSQKQLEDLTTKKSCSSSTSRDNQGRLAKKASNIQSCNPSANRGTYLPQMVFTFVLRRVIMAEKVWDTFLKEPTDTQAILWWPGIAKATEDVLQACTVCQQARPEIMAPWTWINLDRAAL